jgi:hypothetical protein
MRRAVLRSRRPKRLSLRSAIVLIAFLSSSDTRPPQAAGQELTLRSEVDLVSVAVRVTDRKDNGIQGLTANQFSLYEDGKAQRPPGRRGVQQRTGAAPSQAEFVLTAVTEYRKGSAEARVLCVFPRLFSSARRWRPANQFLKEPGRGANPAMRAYERSG